MSQENESPETGEETPIFAVKPNVPRETAQRTFSMYRMFDTPQDGFSVDPESILAGFQDAPGFTIRGDRPVLSGEGANVVGAIDGSAPKERRDQPIGQAWQPDTKAQSDCCGAIMDIVGPKTYRCPQCGKMYKEN
jgi:hypothetical protein